MRGQPLRPWQEQKACLVEKSSPPGSRERPAAATENRLCWTWAHLCRPGAAERGEPGFGPGHGARPASFTAVRPGSKRYWPGACVRAFAGREPCATTCEWNVAGQSSVGAALEHRLLAHVVGVGASPGHPVAEPPELAALARG